MQHQLVGRLPTRLATAKVVPSRQTVIARAEPRLHVPGRDQDIPVDILISSAMHAQQMANCYNNCLAVSVAIVKAAEVLDLPGFRLQFGHLAPVREGVTGGIPHVWVVRNEQQIIDATLNDVMPIDQLYQAKSDVRYVPGKCEKPLPKVGLPPEANTQEKMEAFVNDPERYLEVLSEAAEGTSQAKAHFMYVSLTEGLRGAKEDIQRLLQQKAAAQQ